MGCDPQGRVAATHTASASRRRSPGCASASGRSTTARVRDRALLTPAGRVRGPTRPADILLPPAGRRGVPSQLPFDVLLTAARGIGLDPITLDILLTAARTFRRARRAGLARSLPSFRGTSRVVSIRAHVGSGDHALDAFIAHTWVLRPRVGVGLSTVSLHRHHPRSLPRRKGPRWHVRSASVAARPPRRACGGVEDHEQQERTGDRDEPRAHAEEAVH